jgi:hypothetical protein
MSAQANCVFVEVVWKDTNEDLVVIFKMNKNSVIMYLEVETRLIRARALRDADTRKFHIFCSFLELH